MHGCCRSEALLAGGDMPGAFSRRFSSSNEETLQVALTKDDPMAIDELLDEMCQETGQTPEVLLWIGCVLHRACAAGAVHCVRWLLRVHPSCMNGSDEDGMSALNSLLLVNSPHFHCVRDLLLFRGTIPAGELEAAHDTLSLYWTDQQAASLLQILVNRPEWLGAAELWTKILPLHRLCSLPHLHASSQLLQHQHDISDYYQRVSKRTAYLITKLGHDPNARNHQCQTAVVTLMSSLPRSKKPQKHHGYHLANANHVIRTLLSNGACVNSATRTNFFHGAEETPLAVYLRLLQTCHFFDFYNTQGEAFVEGIRLQLDAGADWERVTFKDGQITTMFSHVIDCMARWASWIVQPEVLTDTHTRFLNRLLQMCNSNFSGKTIMLKDGRQLLSLIGLSELPCSPEFVTGLVQILKELFRSGGNPNLLCNSDVTRSHYLLTMSLTDSLVSAWEKTTDHSSMLQLIDLLAATLSHQNWGHIYQDFLVTFEQHPIRDSNSNLIASGEQFDHVMRCPRRLQQVAAIQVYSALQWQVDAHLDHLQIPSVLQRRLFEFSF